MESIKIVRYIDEPVTLTVAEEQESSGLSWLGRIGADAEHMKKVALDWASEHGVQGDVKSALLAFFDYALEHYLLPDQNSAWLSLRIENPSEAWKVPRPHHDGSYWDGRLDVEGRPAFKVGTVLTGAPTLFWDTSKVSADAEEKAHHIDGTEMFEKLRAEGLKDAMDLGLRAWAAGELEKLQVPIVSPKPGECVRWIVGDKYQAGIHSEPDVSQAKGSRFFISILPGTEAQVRDHAKRWKEPFVAAEEAENIQKQASRL